MRALQVQMAPVDGAVFTPAKFPDLGEATYELPDGRGGLHVETAASMANHLEGYTWDEAAGDQPATLDGLAYVRIVDVGGGLLSSSRVEAHRLASAYIRDGVLPDGQRGASLLEDLTQAHNLPLTKLAQRVFDLDPLSLIHGMFLPSKSARTLKLTRAVLAHIDAYDPSPAYYGGAKNDRIDQRGSKDSHLVKADKLSARGYGVVPYQLTAWTAKQIVLHLVIDDRLIHCYGLSPQRTEVLLALIDYEIAHLLRGPDGLRLRTQCWLAPTEDAVPDDIPTVADASARLCAAIAAQTAADGPGQVQTITWTTHERASQKKNTAKEEQEAS